MTDKRLLKKYGNTIAKRDGGYFCHYCGIAIISSDDRTDWTSYPKYGRHFLSRNKLTEFADFCTVDHKVASAKGGTDDLSNLVLCCAHCNSLKRDTSVAEFLMIIERTDWFKFIGNLE